MSVLARDYARPLPRCPAAPLPRCPAGPLAAVADDARLDVGSQATAMREGDTDEAVLRLVNFRSTSSRSD